jgi:hypothetical protein
MNEIYKQPRNNRVGFPTQHPKRGVHNLFDLFSLTNFGRTGYIVNTDCSIVLKVSWKVGRVGTFYRNFV